MGLTSFHCRGELAEATVWEESVFESMCGCVEWCLFKYMLDVSFVWVIAAWEESVLSGDDCWSCPLLGGP